MRQCRRHAHRAALGQLGVVNDCLPSCVGGHGHSFARLTIIYTGSHGYRAGGTLHKLPATVTYPLSSFGGA